MHYKILGQLTEPRLAELRSVVDYTTPDKAKRHLWDYMPNLEPLIWDILGPQHLELMDVNGKPSIKLFYTQPGRWSPIHKDGLQNLSALNICLDANPKDWVRWWNDEVAQRQGMVSQTVADPANERHSRVIEHGPITKIGGWIDEFRPSAGCVYVLDSDTYHAYYSSGPEVRRVIQLKFKGWPSVDRLLSVLKPELFRL